MKLDFVLDSAVTRVLLQQSVGTVIYQDETPFKTFSVSVDSLKKIIFIKRKGKNNKIIAVLRIKSVTSSLLSGPETVTATGTWAKSRLKLTMTGRVKLHIAKNTPFKHPPSVDLARRFEYGESSFPVLSVCGVKEILVDVPFLKERWKQHYDLLVKSNVDSSDLPQLTYLIICMFAWRSRYVSEKIDSLLQLQILNYEGDCEDQALEIVRVIRGALRAGHSFAARPEVRWLKENVEKAYLVSGVADPGFSLNRSNYIGHCWAAVKLRAGANPAHFGLSKTGHSQLAYLEGTNPVSWGWTSKLKPGCAIPTFAGSTLRNANKGELVCVKFLFDERGRYDVVLGGDSPFTLCFDTAHVSASPLSGSLLRKLDEPNGARLKEQLRTHLTNLTTFSPLICEGRKVKPLFLTDASTGDSLILKDDPFFGAYYGRPSETTALPCVPRALSSV